MDDEEQFMAVAVDGGAPSRSASITQPIQSLVSLPINSQWQRGNLIGRGSFGSVYIATNSKLKHPNIVQYYDSEIVDNWFRIYMEYVPGGSIKKYIKDNGAIPESDVCWFTTHILSGLEYLHSENIVHRDIKGDNLLIDSSGVVRLADFGTAKRLVHGLEPSSPDAVLAVDIWSVGCTFLEMLTGRLPWGDLEPHPNRFSGPRFLLHIEQASNTHCSLALPPTSWCKLSSIHAALTYGIRTAKALELWGFMAY